MLRCYVLEGTVENFNKISGVGPTTLGIVCLSHIPVVKLSDYFRNRNSRMARKARRMSIDWLVRPRFCTLFKQGPQSGPGPPTPCNSSRATHPNIVCALSPLTYRQQTHNMLSTERETCSFWFKKTLKCANWRHFKIRKIYVKMRKSVEIYRANDSDKIKTKRWY